ncbi:hypothetical protein [Vibrio sp. 1180_3]|uniref:hypothetical protein n=1 Tax=Vibrio sp. 1180_3 TaxID=2528832 RepID=UPI0024056220|nr:hypothetical protein [Vibrio sp. 1180_3]MDF9399065.1 hypothetical protein [Vibrio sp. 1180_3]
MLSLDKARMKLATSLMVHAVVQREGHDWIDCFQVGDFDKLDLEYHFFLLVKQNKVPNVDFTNLSTKRLEKFKMLSQHMDFDLGAFILQMWDGLKLNDVQPVKRAGIVQNELKRLFFLNSTNSTKSRPSSFMH